MVPTRETNNEQLPYRQRAFCARARYRDPVAREVRERRLRAKVRNALVAVTFLGITAAAAVLALAILGRR